MQYQFQNSNKTYELQLNPKGQGYLATIEGIDYEVEVLEDTAGQLSLRIQGAPVNVQWAKDGNREWLSANGCTFLLEKPQHKSIRASQPEVKGEVVSSPLPALVRAVNVREGDRVEKDETLLLVEAMKMELQIKAPLAGKIAHVFVTANQTVLKDQALVEIIP